MKSRDGFVAAIVVFIVLALVVIGGIAYVHYVYVPHMAAQNSGSASGATQNAPHIDSFSPSFDLAQPQGGNGSAATVLAPAEQVTIHGSGFTPTGNTVNFSFGPVENLTSTDGQTITFNFSRSAAALARCTGTPMEAAFCEDLPVGAYPISVSNANGASNEVSFHVISTQVAVSATSPSVPAAFSCSYDDGTYVGVVLRAKLPSYMDASITEAVGSEGASSTISEDASKGLFCVKARKAGVDLLAVSEDKKDGNAILTFAVDPQNGQQYTVDATSTAIGLIFQTPYLFTSDPAKAKAFLSAIEKDPGIPEFAQLIRSTSHPANQLNNPTSQIAALFQEIIIRAVKYLTATSTAPTAAEE